MIHTEDSDFTLYQGDAIEMLRALPDGSVHCCVTSPPYWGLRDYGAEGQIGLEQTPDEYVARIVDVFREVRRVLRDDGTLWLNLGDSYANDAKWGGSSGGKHVDALHGQTGIGRQKVTTGLKAKDLVGIPWRVAFALQADGWYLRSDIIWSKPNPMPESVTDRPTKAHEYVFLLSKSARYFFDAEAVKEPAEWARWGAQNGAGKYAGANSGAAMVQSRTKMELQKKAEGSGRNVRSVWEIATQPYAEAHFATFPQELPRRCISAGTSERGCCPGCGAPWERDLTVGESDYGRIKRETGKTWQDMRREAVKRSRGHDGPTRALVGGTRDANGNQFGYKAAERTTNGWKPTCDHGHDPLPCVVIDPFMGSGTVAYVARSLGRRSVGIELNGDYCQLSATRMQQLSLLAD